MRWKRVNVHQVLLHKVIPPKPDPTKTFLKPTDITSRIIKYPQLVTINKQTDLIYRYELNKYLITGTGFLLWLGDESKKHSNQNGFTIHV